MHNPQPPAAHLSPASSLLSTPGGARSVLVMTTKAGTPRARAAARCSRVTQEMPAGEEAEAEAVGGEGQGGGSAYLAVKKQKKLRASHHFCLSKHPNTPSLQQHRRLPAIRPAAARTRRGADAEHGVVGQRPGHAVEGGLAEALVAAQVDELPQARRAAGELAGLAGADAAEGVVERDAAWQRGSGRGQEARAGGGAERGSAEQAGERGSEARR